MAIDYSGRRPVSKNRPRKQPIGMYVLILLTAVTFSFGLGVATGWFLRKPVVKNSQAAPPAATAAAAGSAANPETVAGRAADPPLTFYETLPKGGKAIIGSGLNPKKEEHSQPPGHVSAVTVPQATAVQGTAAQPPVKPEEGKEQRKAPVDQARQQKGAPSPRGEDGKEARKPAPDPGRGGEGDAGASRQEARFCVQVASSRERQEAEALKARLAEKGLAPFIVESSLKDRGTWYRVRLGKHLTQQAASELAAKAGKGAMVIAE